MRTYILLVLFLPALVKAQYCGNSGPAVCTPVSFVAPTNEFADLDPDSLPCIERGVPYNESINLRADSLSIYIDGYHITNLTSISIAKINHLPSGICWATSASNNSINSGIMCLNFSGTTSVPAGAYEVEVVTYVDGGGGIQTSEEPWYFYLRVIEPGAPCQASVIYNDVNEAEAALPELKLVGEKLLATNIQPGAVISIYDLTGRLLKQQTAQQAAEINVAEIHGMFLVNVSNRGNHYTQKFVR